MKRRQVVLVDGSSYLFRAFYAIKGLTDSKGKPTNAIWGVTNMLYSLQNNYPQAEIIVVFDAKGKTFRNSIYPQYKANRPAMPDDLAQQIEPIHNIVRAMGLPLIIEQGVEADDVIGTLSQQACRQNIEVIISTGDKDMTQLVTANVSLINTMSNTATSAQEVEEKYGVKPSQIVDLLALMGDSADNIPGVDKCGPKTAAKWLNEYGSLQQIMLNASKIGGKVGENLQNSLDFLPTAYDLARIRTDLELAENISDLVAKKPDTSQLYELFVKYEFKSLLNKLNASTTQQDKLLETDKDEVYFAPNQIEASYEIIKTAEELDDYCHLLQQAASFAIYLLTDSDDYMQATVCGIALAAENSKAVYIHLGAELLATTANSQRELSTPDNKAAALSQEQVWRSLQPLLESANYKKIAYDLKLITNILARQNIQLGGIGEDIMLASYALDAQLKHDLESIVALHLNCELQPVDSLTGKGRSKVPLLQLAVDDLAVFAATTVDKILQTSNVLAYKLAQHAHGNELYRQLDMPLLSVLSAMEQTGVGIDVAKLQQHSQELSSKIKALTESAYALAGSEFNMDSPKQIREILFDKLQLPVIKKTPSGQPSTAEEVLEELSAAGHDLATFILEYRGLQKLKNTYTDKLPQMVDTTTQRLHTSYNQAVTATGRLSSSNPNLQNIPVRGIHGRRIRAAFVAAKNKQILAADYSQIELRIMAHLSQDENLISAFLDGDDVHQITAAEVFKTPLHQVSNEQRQSAKAVNFGLIYGMSAFGLAKQLKVSRSAAQSYVDAYFARYPQVLNYMQNCKEQALADGFVETEFKRRLYLPRAANNARIRAHIERTAINAPMQGTAADIIKRAMLSIDAKLKKLCQNTHMIMQVHDELVFETPQASAEKVSKLIRTEMENAAQLHVPLVVDIKIGNNWDSAD